MTGTQYTPDSHRWLSLLLVMLVALTLLAACGGRSRVDSDEPDYFKAMRDEILDTIKDVSRAQAMTGELDLMQNILTDAKRLAGEHGQELRNLMQDYNSTPEQFRALFERMDEESALIRERVFDAQSRLKVLATREEWARIAREQEPVLREQLRQFDRLRDPQVRASAGAVLARLED